MMRYYRVVLSFGLALLAIIATSSIHSVPPAKSDSINPDRPIFNYNHNDSQSQLAQSISNSATITTIAITDQGFAPSAATIIPGTTVRWVNQTGQTQQLASTSLSIDVDNSIEPHILFLPLISKDSNTDQSNFRSQQNQTWQSGVIPPGGSFEQTFDQAGQYPYQIANSPLPAGVIIVQPPLISAKSGATFTDVSQTSGLATAGNKQGGLSWGDFNNDGCLDAVVNTDSSEVKSRLYQQTVSDSLCSGLFTDVTSDLAPGLLISGRKERSAIWGDINNDGYLDFAVNRFSRIEVYLNKGPSGTPQFGFGDASGFPSQAINSFSNSVNSSCPRNPQTFNMEAMGWLDYDNDNDLDLIADNHNHGTIIFQNDGSGTLTDLDPTTVGLPSCDSATRGDYGAFTDFDADGDVDFIDRKRDALDLWVNDGTGDFSQDTNFDQQASGNKGGSAFCDFDNDGDFDLFWADNDTNQIWRNDDSTFIATGLPTGISGNIDGVVCGDVDNDSDLDLFLTSNNNDLLFLNESSAEGLAFTQNNLGITGALDGEGAALGDYDRDGDLDLLINQDYSNELWRNEVNNDSYLMVRAWRDFGDNIVRDDIGATVTLSDCQGNLVAGVREVNGGRGHGSQDPALVHFGLPSGPASPYIVNVKFVGGQVVQRAVVPGSLETYQLLEVKNSDIDDITACQTDSIDLALSKSDSSDPVTSGDVLTYTLAIANNGPAQATGVVAIDTLPPEVAFNAERSSQICADVDGTVSCDVGTLAASQPFTVEIVVTVEADSGLITNTATITANQLDTNLTNNTATQETQLLGELIVTNTNDDGPGSLRQIISSANLKPGFDTISFNIPGSGPHTISPVIPLPTVIDPVLIDGATQPGASCDPQNLLIAIDGSSTGSEADGLNINAGDSTIRGLAIQGFAGDGLELSTNGSNLVECNLLTQNNGNGINVTSGVSNTLTINSIFDNGQLGIDLGGDGVTDNDGDDLDQGANGLQNYPVVTRAFAENGGTIVEGRLASTAETTFKLDFFSTTTCDPTNFGEGQTFLTSISATTNISGHVSFTDTLATAVPVDTFITAIATDPAGNSSEFSQCTPVSIANETWPRALRLNPGDSSPASAEQYLAKLGQSRWYKVKVQPGSQVIVTLTNLPENYDLTVYKDIRAEFESLENPDSLQDLIELGAEFAPGSRSPDEYAPGSRSPDAYAPGSRSPDAFAPNVFAPAVYAPGSRSPDEYAPGSRSPDAFAPGSRSPDIFAPDAFSPDAFAPGSRSPDAIAPGSRSPESFSSAQTHSLIAVSAFEATASEGIIANTWNNTGDFYIRVRGRDGAFNLEQKFKIEVTLSTGTCDGISSDLTSSSTTATNGNFKTIILTDLARMEGSAADKAALQERLNTFAARSEVAGVIVDVGADARVAAANNQADANVTCPYAKNLVAESIKKIVDTYWAANPLEYVVVVGNDEVIPFFRYPDNASLGPEADYVPPVFDFTHSEASLRLNYVLGQDAYGSSIDLSFEEGVIPIPDLAVGRLVETPSDVTTLLDAYLATPNGVVATPNSALVTGYDFLDDAAIAIQAELEAGLGTAANTLIAPNNISPQDPRSWTAAELREKLLGSRHDLIFLGGHFSASSALAADYETRLLSTDLTSSPVDLENAIIFSIGCHSGYNIVNSHGIPGVTREPDWAQAFTQKGATLIAGTGYQYGDTDFVEYGERLYLEFSRELRTSSGSISIGQAMVNAKQTYLAETPEFRDLHEKTFIQTTIFGLPMLSVDLPASSSTSFLSLSTASSAVGSLNDFQTNPGATLGLEFTDIEIAPSFSEETITLINTEETGLATVEALVLRGSDGVLTNPSEPALPLEAKNVSAANTVMRGVGFREGTYVDRANVFPLTGAPTTEIRGVHTSFPSEVFFPVQPWQTNYLGGLTGGNITLFVTPAQFKSTAPGSQTNTLRQYNQMKIRLYYSNNLETFGDEGTPALASAPSIVGVLGIIEEDKVNFEVNVVGDPAAGIQEVWVTYTATSGPLVGQWQSLDLKQSQSDSTLWTETLNLNGTPPEDIRYMVQAVNGVGLVQMSTNLGDYYIPGSNVGANLPTEISLQLPASSGTYGSRATFSANLTSNGTPLSGQPVTFRIGSQTGQAVTDNNGKATINFLLLSIPGNKDIKVTFEGTTDYQAAATSRAFELTKRDTRILLDPVVVTGLPTEDILTIATLTEAPVPGQSTEPRRLNEQTVIFVITGPNGSHSEAIITDYIGRALLGNVPLPPGNYDFTVYYNGVIPLSTEDTITLMDSRYNPTTASGKITIQNSVPVAVDDTAMTDEDTAVTIDVLANDSNGEPEMSLTVAEVTSPTNGTVVNNGNNVTYTPDPNFNGIDTFTYRASDGFDQSNLATVTVTVKPVNDPPVANDDRYTFNNEKKSLWIMAPGILKNDTDVDGDPLSAILVDRPANGQFYLKPNGSFDYRPNANFSGIDTFTYKVNDGQADSNIATVTIEVPAKPAATIYLSSSSSGRIAGVRFADEDILVYDTANDTWSLYFDGSDVGVGNNDIDAFFITDAGHILISFQTPKFVSGAGKVETADIVEFTPSSLGTHTAGTFKRYFDGSDVGLTKGNENIDAIGFTPDGRLVISTSGSFQVPGASGQDEDLIVFNATSFGIKTRGDWEMYFDGSDVGLNHPKEDIWGTWIDPETGNIYLTTRDDFSVYGVEGDGDNIFICQPESLGQQTACTFKSFWNGSEFGFGHEDSDGLLIDLED